MCLRIDKLKHHKWFSFNSTSVRPIKLDKNLDVYKVLVADVSEANGNMFFSNNFAETPFQHTIVEFVDGLKYLQRIPLDDFSKYNVVNVEKGKFLRAKQPVKNGCAYHSYTDFESAMNLAKELYLYVMQRMGCYDLDNVTYRHAVPLVYKATIPSGAHVYYGDKGEIASDEIVVTNLVLGTPGNFEELKLKKHILPL